MRDTGELLTVRPLFQERELSADPVLSSREDSILVYLTTSQLMNSLALNAVSVVPDDQYGSELSSLAVSGLRPLGFRQPATLDTLDVLFPDTPKHELLAVRLNISVDSLKEHDIDNDVLVLPQFVSFERVVEVITATDEQFHQLRGTASLMGFGERLPRHRTGRHYFDGSVTLPPTLTLRLSSGVEPDQSTALRRYEKLLGSLVAGPGRDGALDTVTAFTLTIASAISRGRSESPEDALQALGPVGVSSSEPAALLWLGSVTRSEPEVTLKGRSDADVIAEFDNVARQTILRTVLSFEGHILDAKGILGEVVRVAVTKGHELGLSIGDRYDRASARMKRVWDNEENLETLLHSWIPGFDALKALLILGEARADDFDRIAGKLKRTAVEEQTAAFVRTVFGMAFGIRAIPGAFRPKARAVDTAVQVVLTVLNPDSEPSLKLQVDKFKQGRSNKVRIATKVFGIDRSFDFTERQYEAAKLSAAAALLPVSDRKALLPLARRNKMLSPYVVYKSALPESARFEEGSLLIASGKKPQLRFELAWEDWDGFLADLPKALERVKREQFRRWRETVTGAHRRSTK